MLEETIDENYEPTQEEMEEYAKWLGMDLQEDKHLFWVAREGLKAPLPSEWKPCQSPDGELYYFNFSTGQSVWEHPCDERHKTIFRQEKEWSEYGSAMATADLRTAQQRLAFARCLLLPPAATDTAPASPAAEAPASPRVVGWRSRAKAADSTFSLPQSPSCPPVGLPPKGCYTSPKRKKQLLQWERRSSIAGSCLDYLDTDTVALVGGWLRTLPIAYVLAESYYKSMLRGRRERATSPSSCGSAKLQQQVVPALQIAKAFAWAEDHIDGVQRLVDRWRAARLQPIERCKCPVPSIYVAAYRELAWACHNRVRQQSSSSSSSSSSSAAAAATTTTEGGKWSELLAELQITTENSPVSSSRSDNTNTPIETALVDALQDGHFPLLGREIYYSRRSDYRSGLSFHYPEKAEQRAQISDSSPWSKAKNKGRCYFWRLEPFETRLEEPSEGEGGVVGDETDESDDEFDSCYRTLLLMQCRRPAAAQNRGST